MLEKSTGEMQKCCWADVRDQVHLVNSKLASAIDAVDPSSDFTLWRVRYPFGANICLNGKLQIPNTSGELRSIDDSSFDGEVRNSLQYNHSIPAGIVLNKKVELYLDATTEMVPFSSMSAGSVFGLWNLLNIGAHTAYASDLWRLIAGARSLLFLSKISDTLGHKRLKKAFNLSSPVPNGIGDQWSTLKEVATAPDFKTDWHCDIIFFSKQWCDAISKDNSTWHPLKIYLLESDLSRSSFLKDKDIYNTLMSHAVNEKKLKPNYYFADTVKHLLGIGAGVYQAYTMARSDEAGPVSKLQEVFDDIYQLRFQPTMAHIGLMDTLHHNQAFYYSLEFPLSVAYDTKTISKINDLREIKLIQQAVTDFWRSSQKGFENTPLADILNKVTFSYHHSDEDAYGEVEDTRCLIDRDPTLIAGAKLYPEKPFCSASLLLRGCVRISREN